MAERTGQRVAALVLAAVFFFSSVALTGFVIWQIRKDSKATTSQNTPEQTPTNTNKKETTKLEGTQLANFTPITTPVTEIQKTDLVEGTGTVVEAGASVTAHYTGAYAATGVIFQSSKDTGKPVPFSLSGVIAGWTEGVPGMKVGGTRRLVIPAEKAYGPVGANGETKDASGRPLGPLVFDVEITAVN